MREILTHLNQKEEIDCGVACTHMIFRYHGYLTNYTWLRNKLIDSSKGTTIANLISFFADFNIKSTVFRTNFDYLANHNISLKKQEFPLIALTGTIEKGLYHYIVIYNLNKGYITYSDPQEDSVKKIHSSEFIHNIKYLIKTDFSNFSNKHTDYVIKETNNFIIKNIIKEKSRFLIISILSIITSLIGILLASKFGLLVNAIETSSSSMMFIVYLYIFFILLIIISSTKSAITFLKNILSTKTIKKIEYNINKDIINIFIKNPCQNIKKIKSGEILSRISDCLLLSSTINQLLINLLPDIIITIFGFIYMFILNFKLSLLILLSCVILIIISQKTFNKIYTNNIKEQQNYATYNGNLLETLESLEEIKTNNRENYYKTRVLTSLKQYQSSSLVKENYGNYISIIQNLFSITFGIGVIILGVFEVMETNMSIGNLSIFVTLSEIIQSVLLEIVLFQFQLEGFLTAYNRILQVFFNNKESNHHIQMYNNVDSIIFENFTINHDDNNIIKNMNLEISNKNIFISGESGSGKSSIAKCLAGLSDNYTGKIYLKSNGQIKAINECNVVYLSNESNLFTGTIRDNLCLGKSVTDKHINKLCEDFAIKGFIDSLPKGIYEKIKPNQTNLSTGQKQRLALIRSIISEPDVLILDEALSNIDTINKKVIIGNLNNYNFMKIYISHEDLDIKNSDKYWIKEKNLTKEMNLCYS